MEKEKSEGVWIELSDLEAIVYGYGKAIEKLNRQSEVVKRQTRQLQKFKAQIEEEREARERRAHEQWMIKTGNIRDWYEKLELSELKHLQNVYQDYVRYCNEKHTGKVEYRAFGIELRNLGCIFIRKRDGMWVVKP